MVTLVLSNVILATVLGLAVYADCRERRLPNWLTLSAAVCGVIWSSLPEGSGLLASLGGCATALACLLPLYAMRVIGPGDVKLMAAVGTYLGPSATFAAMIYAFAVGGLLTLAWSWRAGVCTRMLANLRAFAYVSLAQLASLAVPRMRDLPLTGVRVPYALAIAGGVLIEQIVLHGGGAGG